MGNKETFAKNLSYYISRSGKTQKELSEIWGIPATTVNCWVCAKRFPRIDTIEFLSNYFGVPKSALIEERTDTEGADLSMAKRKLIDLAKDCSEDDAERLLQMFQLVLGRK